jgi:hypothetical protein
MATTDRLPPPPSLLGGAMTDRLPPPPSLLGGAMTDRLQDAIPLASVLVLSDPSQVHGPPINLGGIVSRNSPEYIQSGPLESRLNALSVQVIH